MNSFFGIFATIFGLIFLASIITFACLASIWTTGILLDIHDVRWYMQFNAIVTVTSLIGTCIMAAFL